MYRAGLVHTQVGEVIKRLKRNIGHPQLRESKDQRVEHIELYLLDISLTHVNVDKEQQCNINQPAQSCPAFPDTETTV